MPQERLIKLLNLQIKSIYVQYDLKDWELLAINCTIQQRTWIQSAQFVLGFHILDVIVQPSCEENTHLTNRLCIQFLTHRNPLEYNNTRDRLIFCIHTRALALDTPFHKSKNLQKAFQTTRKTQMQIGIFHNHQSVLAPCHKHHLDLQLLFPPNPWLDDWFQTVMVDPP